MSPVQALPPELVGLTLLRVPLPRTLFHERSRCLVIEGLCGTSKRWMDNLRGNRGSEGQGLPPCNRVTPLPRRRADLEPHSSEPLFAEFDRILCIPWMPTLFPERLAGLSGQSGGTTGGRSARTGTNGQVQGEA